MPKYSVPIYFVCYIDVEAENADEAFDIAGVDETEFNVTTDYVNKAGGCPIYYQDTGSPILLEEEDA